MIAQFAMKIERKGIYSPIKICNIQTAPYFFVLLVLLSVRQSDYNAVVMANKFLMINLSHLHLRSLRNIQNNYVSIYWQKRFYFSNAYSSSQAVQYSITLNHNIFLPLQGEEESFSLSIQAWENHMIVFQHEVDMLELTTRLATRKKIEIRQGQILDFTAHLLKENQFHLSPVYNPSVIQHFLFIYNLTLHEQSKAPDQGPSYFVVIHDTGSILVPVTNSVVIVPLPSKMKFQHYKNGKLRSTSGYYNHEQIDQQFTVRMIAGEDIGYDLSFDFLWGINLWHNHPERSMLLDSQQISIYEIQVRYEGWRQNIGLKLKVNYGNKSFQLNGQPDASGILRIPRIVYFVMKSEEDDFMFVIQKNSKIAAKVVVAADELLSYHLNSLKRKMMDTAGTKQMATLRFKCEKAKNLSLPQNNPFWKKNITKGKLPAICLQFSQLSIQWQKNQVCSLILKSQEEQFYISQLSNIQYFQLMMEIPEPVVMTLHQETNVYLKVVNPQQKDDFIGIAVLNFKQLKLGKNVLTIPFFKQQTATCLLHLYVNKAVPWAFVKGVSVPQSIGGASFKLIGVSIQIKRIQLSAYYYTYQYDRKTELYCIVEINRIKKVLILQSFNSMTRAPLFVNASGSDLLNFTVDHNQSAKVKFTLVIADGGFDEQVYGMLQKRIKIDDLKQGPVRIDKLALSNDHGISVGQLDFEVQIGLSGQFKKPIKKDLKTVQNSLDKVNKSIQKMQKNIKYNKANNRQNISPKRRYQSIKLPQIIDPKQQRLKKFAKMLQMRQKSIDQRKAGRQKRVQSERLAEITPQSRIKQNYTSLDINEQPINRMKNDSFPIQQEQNYMDRPYPEQRINFNTQDLPQVEENQFAGFENTIEPIVDNQI